METLETLEISTEFEPISEIFGSNKGMIVTP